MKKAVSTSIVKVIFVTSKVALLVLGIASSGYCNESFYKNHARGWHWYERNKENEEVIVTHEQNSKPSAITPTQEVENIKKEAESKLHNAMIKPTEENVIEYIKTQEKITDRSEKFSEVWQKVVYKNPELDRTLKHPVSYNALHISKEEVSKNKRQKIRELSKEYGLMYFFRGDCKYCQGFSSVVKRFANEYSWDLMPVQIGDVPIEGFENAKKDNGVSTQLGIKAVPALIAVHPKSGDMIPLAFGYISESEIEERVDALVVNKEATKKAVELIRSQGR
jgi:conjugal transfer pilus assembly protein TraF